MTDKLEEIQNNNELSGIEELLGFKGDEYNNLIAKSGKLMNEALLSSKLMEQKKLNIEEAIKSATIAYIEKESANNQRDIECLRSFVSCDQTAKTDWAINSGHCGITAGTVLWAFCQGTANLSYAADEISCMRNYDSCEGNSSN